MNVLTQLGSLLYRLNESIKLKKKTIFVKIRYLSSCKKSKKVILYLQKKKI